MPTRLAIVSLWAEDVAAAEHFYRAVLGLSLLPQPSGRPHFDLGGQTLVILQGKPLPAQNAVPPVFAQLALAVDDLDAAYARLVQHRVDAPWGIQEDGFSRWVMFQDPGGNLIELVQFKA